MIVYIIIGVVLLLLLFFVTTYNSLVTKRNRVHDQWSQIEVQLKRRFDLIPNLLETVKGYAKHEDETLKGVIEARNKFNAATTVEQEMDANNQLTGFMNKLFALSESYPDLKANQNFLDMQATLKETEDKIASARQFYNDTVLTLNNKIDVFPSNLVAKLFNVKKETFFEINESEKETPKISF